MPKVLPRVILLTTLVGLVGLVYILDLDSYLTLHKLQQHRATLIQYYAQRPVLVLSLYAGLYALVAALAVPGASALTVAGGAVLGFWIALPVVSIASTVGATLAFWLSRYLARDWVQQNFAQQLEQINAGMHTEGVSYLLALRLIPVFPFFLVNALMGLTYISTSTYFLISLVGMLPGTAAYVYAGRTLGQLQSPGDVLSWPMLGALIVLGVIPLLARRLLSYIRIRSEAKKRGSEEPPHQKTTNISTR